MGEASSKNKITSIYLDNNFAKVYNIIICKMHTSCIVSNIINFFEYWFVISVCGYLETDKLCIKIVVKEIDTYFSVKVVNMRFAIETVAIWRIILETPILKIFFGGVCIEGAFIGGACIYGAI